MEKNIQIFEELIKNNERIVIDLGCGPNKSKNSIGIDMFNYDNVDIVTDLEKGLSFIPDKSVDEISSRHFLEHIENYELMITEIHRILKTGGIHKAIVPYFANPHYYSDYTHKRFFGLYSFDYFATEESKLKRKVPSYGNAVKFNIITRRLNFKSQAKIRNLIKRPLKWIFNRSFYFLELYEEMFSYTFPCQEIYFEMTPKHEDE